MQTEYVRTKQTHSKQIDPFSVLWRFPEYDPLEDCELFDFYVVLITVVYIFTSQFWLIGFNLALQPAKIKSTALFA